MNLLETSNWMTLNMTIWNFWISPKTWEGYPPWNWLTDIAPENWWFRRWSFPFGMSHFHGRTVSLPEGSHSHFPAMKEDDFKKLAVLGWCIEWLQVGVRFRWRDVTYHIHVRYNATYIYIYIQVLTWCNVYNCIITYIYIILIFLHIV